MDFVRIYKSKAFTFLLGMMVAYLTSYVYLGNDKHEPSVRCQFEESQSRKLLGFTRYAEAESDQFKSLVARKAPANDPELVEFVRKVIDPPGTSGIRKMSRPLLITPQASEVDKLLGGQKRGFFVEAGGLDGERSSNSIFFELKRNWTGLLVEPDPYFYTQLVGKNRNCWSINACLSTSPFVTEMNFQESSGGHGKLTKKASMGVPCFPLETILFAINVSTVDFFSLDVEGFELDVLKTLSQSAINIRSLAVEYSHGVEDEYKKYMVSKGYNVSARLHLHKPEFSLYVDDFIFFKN